MEVVLSPGVIRLGIPVPVLLAQYHAAQKEGAVSRLEVDGHTIWACDQGDRVRFSLPHEAREEDGASDPILDPSGFATLDEVIEAHEVYQGRTFAELQQAALEIAREQGRITADDIRERVVVHGDRRIIGTVLAKLCRDGWLTPVDYVATRVRTSHARPIRVFQYTGRRPALAEETAAGLPG